MHVAQLGGVSISAPVNRADFGVHEEVAWTVLPAVSSALAVVTVEPL